MRPNRPGIGARWLEISIHALRKECDLCTQSKEQLRKMISIHALRKECDYTKPLDSWHLSEFLSTHSVRSATYSRQWAVRCFHISIHALRKECDLSNVWLTAAAFRFLSTHSVRSATEFFAESRSVIKISIHALRKECDGLSQRYACSASFYFYPRTP